MKTATRPIRPQSVECLISIPGRARQRPHVILWMQPMVDGNLLVHRQDQRTMEGEHLQVHRPHQVAMEDKRLQVHHQRQAATVEGNPQARLQRLVALEDNLLLDSHQCLVVTADSHPLLRLRHQAATEDSHLLAHRQHPAFTLRAGERPLLAQWDYRCIALNPPPHRYLTLNLNLSDRLSRWTHSPAVPRTRLLRTPILLHVSCNRIGTRP